MKIPQTEEKGEAKRNETRMMIPGGVIALVLGDNAYRIPFVESAHQ
jgi:hypothetical protein